MKKVLREPVHETVSKGVGGNQQQKGRKNSRAYQFGTWNVRTLQELGKLHLMLKEREQLKLDVLGLCETRWSGEGHFASGDKLVISSGSPDGGYGGVAVILSAAVKNSLLSYTPVSNRLLVVRIQATPAPITIIQVYAPTSSCSAEEKDDCYEILQAVIDAMKSRQVCVFMGDFNAKLGVGRDFESWCWGLWPWRAQ